MKVSLKEILHSKEFLREISNLCFFFAGFNFLIGLIAVVAAGQKTLLNENFIGGIFVALIFVALGWFMRRGSRVAFWLFVGLIALDSILLVLMPETLTMGAIIGRVILIFFIVRNVLRRRAILQNANDNFV